VEAVRVEKVINAPAGIITRSSHLESLLDWDEERVEAFGLEQRFLLVDDNALVEAANAVISDVKGVGVGEECQSVWIVDIVRASITVRQRH
jgi:hypothetical protein